MDHRRRRPYGETIVLNLPRTHTRPEGDHVIILVLTHNRSFIKTLAAEKDVDVNTADLNKSSASATINDLKNKETKNPDATAGAPIQDPNSWATGEDKATGKQQGYIAVMAKEAGEQVPGGEMGKSEASKKIGELKSKTGM